MIVLDDNYRIEPDGMQWMLYREGKLNKKGHSPAEITDQAACVGCAFCATMCPDCVITVEK